VSRMALFVIDTSTKKSVKTAEPKRRGAAGRVAQLQFQADV
jgi:hypothetical protein